ncbi:MAG: hypothetical protein JKX73_09825 [Flavobacteriales bacterium]|nr:hypothetical protein [Flavobacteriales bacterium]
MKQALSIGLLIVVFATSVKSQSFIYDPDQKGKTDVQVYAEGSEREKKKLLLISYMPVMHVPDPAGNVELFVKSGLDMNGLYDRFRQGLDVSLSDKCKEGFVVTSLLRANDSTKEDLNRIYGAARYTYDERPLEVGEPKKFGRLSVPTRANKAVKKPSRDVQTVRKDGQLASRDIDRSKQYMNVSVPDTTLLAYLNAKYDADILLFVNQFEVKKSFADGSDIAYGKYGREVMIHYSVFDRSGTQLYGNSSADQIVEKQDNINEIMAKTYPVIAEDVFSHIPGARNNEAVDKMSKEYQKKAENQDILRKD